MDVGELTATLHVDTSELDALIVRGLELVDRERRSHGRAAPLSVPALAVLGLTAMSSQRRFSRRQLFGLLRPGCR